MRLNKYLARAGVDSRRRCDDWIRAGRVSVNGIVETEPWFDIDPDHDLVHVDGEPVEQPRGQAYLLLHKPAGVITTVSDPRGRPTVVSLLGDAFQDRRLYPVGRLDADTTGALLLTDDGELAYRLTHPKYEAEKEYVVLLQRRVSGRDIERLKKGIQLEDGPVRPDSIRRLAPERVSLTLHEGRKRIVKRMFAILEHDILELHRSRFAGLCADEIPRGSWRELTLEETNKLRDSVGLEPIDNE